MSYLLKSKPRNQYRFKLALIFGLFFFIIFLAFFFSSFLRNSTHFVARPIWIVSHTISKPFRSLGDFFTLKNNLIGRNLHLEEELANLKLKTIDYDLILSENKDLKNQLDILDNSERILSSVLSKPPFSPYDTLVIDAGSNKGVKVGDRVYMGKNTIIGTISSVTSNTSLVNLFSSGDKKQEFILSRTGTSFGVNGRGGGNFSLEIPKDTDIVWGDSLSYPGTSSVVGNVYYIDTNTQSSFKTVYLRISDNVFSAKWVYIEKVD